MLGSIQTHFWAVRDYLAPVLRDSKFKESGRITPEEFVAAGDFLVYKFPTWQWEAGDSAKRRDFLPADKQYLVSRNVPCLRRVSQLAYGGGQDEDAETMMNFAAEGGADDDGEDWVATHTSSKDSQSTSGAPTIGDIPDLDGPDAGANALLTDLAGVHIAPIKPDTAPPAEEMPDMDDIPDMDDDDLAGGGLVEEEDDAAVAAPAPAAASASDNLVQVRTYDCSITYDKYYQTPRMWLLGYDEHKSPLPPTSALEDVSADHAQKTVTIEPFPHSTLSMASVHPCKHSSVMKKVIERMDRNVVEAQRQQKELEKREKKEGKGKWGIAALKKSSSSAKDATSQKEDEEGPEGLRVDQYLVVFLKFMSSIVPTIEVDATNSI